VRQNVKGKRNGEIEQKWAREQSDQRERERERRTHGRLILGFQFAFICQSVQKRAKEQ
jgi:hypothetical protein